MYLLSAHPFCLQGICSIFSNPTHFLKLFFFYYLFPLPGPNSPALLSLRLVFARHCLLGDNTPPHPRTPTPLSFSVRFPVRTSPPFPGSQSPVTQTMSDFGREKLCVCCLFLCTQQLHSITWHVVCVP